MFQKIFTKIFFNLFLWKHRKKFPKKFPNVPSIKESNVKPSHREKLVEVKPEVPKEGGLFTHFPNQKFPFPGFPDKKIVVRVGFAKRLIPLGIDWMHKRIKPFIPKNPNLYCRFVREMYRVWNIIIERETRAVIKKKYTKMRDICCVYAEYDDYYRFVGQDAAGEIRLEELTLRDADKWWFLRKPYTFRGKKEFKERYGEGIEIE